MATQDASHGSTLNFMVPPEPCPLPSLGADEESFVVLWKDNCPSEYSSDAMEPIGTSVVEEAKQLINKELLQMEQLSLSQNAQSNGESSLVNSQTTSEKDVEQSTSLPQMLQKKNGYDTQEVKSITTLPSDFASVEVQQIFEENVQLKDTILQNNMSLAAQYKQIVSWQEEVQKVHQINMDKLMEAKACVEKLKKENCNLIRDLKTLRETKTKQDEELASLKAALIEKDQQTKEKLVESSQKNMNAFELDIANKKIKDLELTIQNLTEENSILKSDQENKSIGKNEEYEKQIVELQEALDKSKLAIEEVKMELLKERTTNEAKDGSLNEMIDNLRSQLFYKTQEQMQLPSSEDVANIRQQLTNTQVILTQVELNRSSACAQLEALIQENSKLKEHVTQTQSQIDEIYALQTQLDVFKADFEAERDAKETIKTDNVKLAEDMQNLQRRNQQLQEEIELLRERDFVVCPPYRREQSHSVEASAPSASNDHSKKCPKCSFGFNTYQALENHVYRCIDLDDSLP